MATHRRVRRSFLRFHDAASENNHKIMLNPGYLLPRAKQKAPRAYASHPDYEVVPDSWAAASRDRKHLLSQVRPWEKAHPTRQPWLCERCCCRCSTGPAVSDSQ